MIRDKNKIYAETNHPDTVIITNNTSIDRVILGTGNKGVRTANFLGPGILIKGSSGNWTSLLTAGKPNCVIATDDNGNIILLDRSNL